MCSPCSRHPLVLGTPAGWACHSMCRIRSSLTRVPERVACQCLRTNIDLCANGLHGAVCSQRENMPSELSEKRHAWLPLIYRALTKAVRIKNTFLVPTLLAVVLNSLVFGANFGYPLFVCSCKYNRKRKFINHIAPALSALAKWRKATTIFVISACPQGTQLLMLEKLSCNFMLETSYWILYRNMNSDYNGT